MAKELTVKQKLIKARKLIRKGWSRKAFARDKYRHSADIFDKRAVKFCAVGACMKVGVSSNNIQKILDNLDVVEFNDSQTSSAPVLALFDKAIAACK